MSPDSGRRPVVGITAYEEQARWNQWDERAVVLHVAYVRSVERAGGVPVLIPVQDLAPEDATSLVERLDALVLTGGPDVDPARYGAEPHPETSSPRAERDALEDSLLRAAAGRRPTLGICRGMQLLNVARGGTLNQHLPDVLGHTGHSPAPGEVGAHAVVVEPGTLLRSVLGAETAEVRSHHHQGIEQLGSGLKVSAVASDGTIEAVEDPSAPFLLAVLWHPESGQDLSLFEGLVAAARGRSGRSA